jgi:hypothetical protein
MMEIKNRIVGSGVEQLDNIQFNYRNWRIHPLTQQNALLGVLEQVGWVQEVIVNKRTGNLVDGHLRCQLAAREGETTIPVKYVDLTEEEEMLVLASIDPIAGLATTDKQKLGSLIKDIESQNIHVQKMLDDLKRKENVFNDEDIQDQPDYEISAELLERHDYLVFYFDNELDWQVACQKFGVEPVISQPVGHSTAQKKGLGRVLNGKLIIK